MKRRPILLLIALILSGVAAPPSTHAMPLAQAPLNDDFDQATVINTTPYTNLQDTSNATTAWDDPILTCGWREPDDHSHSVWYTFTPPTNGALHVDTAGSDYDTVLAVWSGARGSLTEIACNDDVSYPGPPIDLTSAVNHLVTAGTPYYIEIVAYDNTAGGNLTLNVDFTQTAPASKEWYLLENGNNDRLYPQPDANPRTLRFWGGSAHTWTQSPPFAAPFAFLEDTARLHFYIPNILGWGTPRVRVELYQGSSLIGYGERWVLNTGWYPFVLPHPNVTVPGGSALQVRIANVGSWWSAFDLRYGGTDTYRAYLEALTTTYVNIEALSMGSACHPQGSTTFNVGQTLTATTRVADPFGSYDVAGALLRVTAPDGTDVVPETTLTPARSDSRTLTYTHAFAIPPAAPGIYTAVVTGTESNGIVDTSEVTFTVQQPATLTIALAAPPSSIVLGAPLTVTLHVTNTGGAAAVNVTPSPLIVNGTGSVTLTDGPSPPTVATLPGGASTAFTWTYTATGIGSVDWTGHATAMDANACTLLASAEATSAPVLIGGADLALTKAATPEPVLAGSSMTYTLTYENSGTSTAEGVVLTDTLPVFVTFGGNVSIPPGWVQNTTTPPTWSTTAIPAGAGGTLVFTATVAPGATGSLHNTATLASTTPEYDLANNTATVTSTVLSPPLIAFDNAAYTSAEDAGTTGIPVQLEHAYPLTVTVDVTTADGTATAGDDYTAAADTLVFSPGVTSTTFTVTLLDDVYDEPDETVVLTLANPTGGTLGSPPTATLTLLDNDPPPAVQFDSGIYTLGEDAGSILVGVELSLVSAFTVTVDYATADGSATAGVDYQATAGTLIFAPGEDRATFSIPVLDDTTEESDETVDLSLSNPNNAMLGSPDHALLYILDDDADIRLTKSVQPSTQIPNGTVTYTLTIENQGTRFTHLKEITDTLPLGFIYGTDVSATPAGCTFRSTPAPGATGTLTWEYQGTCRLDPAAQATLVFTATTAGAPDTYFNSAGVRLRGNRIIAREDLAPVTVISDRVYRIEAQVGHLTIVAYVRLSASAPVILSWEIQP
ncbi:MAG: Calx-beta domain-containing protein [Anaerolineae bacterium]